MRKWYILSIAVLILNFAGFGLLYNKLELLSRQLPLSGQQESIKNVNEIQAQLTQLQNQLAQSHPVTNLNPVLGAVDLLPDRSATSANTSSTFISISSDWTSPVKVYKEQAQYSAVLGQLIPDYKYPYYTKLDGWYLVSLSDDKTGWVKVEGVFENQ